MAKQPFNSYDIVYKAVEDSIDIVLMGNTLDPSSKVYNMLGDCIDKIGLSKFPYLDKPFNSYLEQKPQPRIWEITPRIDISGYDFKEEVIRNTTNHFFRNLRVPQNLPFDFFAALDFDERKELLCLRLEEFLKSIQKTIFANCSPVLRTEELERFKKNYSFSFDYYISKEPMTTLAQIPNINSDEVFKNITSMLKITRPDEKNQSELSQLFLADLVKAMVKIFKAEFLKERQEAARKLKAIKEIMNSTDDLGILKKITLTLNKYNQK